MHACSIGRCGEVNRHWKEVQEAQKEGSRFSKTEKLTQEKSKIIQKTEDDFLKKKSSLIFLEKPVR